MLIIKKTKQSIKNKQKEAQILINSQMDKKYNCETMKYMYQQKSKLQKITNTMNYTSSLTGKLIGRDNTY